MNKTLIFLLMASIAMLFSSCEQTNQSRSDNRDNPPAPGFDIEHSDPAAVELADSVMAAMGGRDNWDNTRFISWNFSSIRTFLGPRLSDLSADSRMLPYRL